LAVVAFLALVVFVALPTDRIYMGIILQGIVGLGSLPTTNFGPAASVSVTLNAPSSGSSLLPSTVSFTYTPVSVGSAIQNSSLWTNATGSWVQTATNVTAVVNGTQNTMNYALNSPETVLWNVEVFNSAGGAFASSNYTLVVTNDVTVSTSEDVYVTSGNSQQYLVRTSTGVLYCLYFRISAGNYAVFVKSSADDGSTWANETLISSLSSMSGYSNDFNSMAVDSNNNLHVVWEGESSSYSHYQIWYSRYNGTAWSTPIVLSTYAGMNTSTQNSPAIAVDSNNNLHVVWYGQASGYSNKQIWEADYNGAAWSTPVRLSTVDGMSSSPILKFPCIVVDSNNNLDVLFRGNATGYTNSGIWFTRRTSGTWSTPVVVSTYPGMNSTDQISPGLAIDSKNNVYAGWNGNAAGYSSNQIWIAVYNGAWQTPVRVSTYSGMSGYAQGEPSIAVDTSGRVHVLWHGEATGYTDNDKVWYSNCTNGVWSTPQCLQPSPGLNNYPNVRWSNYPSFNVPSSRLDYVFTVGTSPYNVTFSYLTLPSPPTVHLLLTEDPTQATYTGGQSVNLTVDVLNQLSQPLNSTLTLTVTGPRGYYYLDFQTIDVTANSVGEYSFAWSFPNVAGKYYVEVGLVPPQLTAYDAAWLQVT
jgi:hypothetical protein